MQGLPAKVSQCFLRPGRQKTRFGAESGPIGPVAQERIAD